MALYRRLQDHLAPAVEQLTLPATIGILIGFVATRIAVADANDFSWSGHRKMQQFVRIGYFSALAIGHTDIHNDSIPAIRQ